jgi:quercetin dioxygenase-like cupin family protein
MARVVVLGTIVSLFATIAMAQDPVKVDPKHYKVEVENARVRVLHVQYGPHEKSVMHRHPDGVAVFLADQDAKFTLPDGKTVERHGKAGEVLWMPAETHLPENMSDKPLDVIVVELKGKAGAAKRTK